MDNEKTKVQYRAWAKNVRRELGKEKLQAISTEIVNKIRKLKVYKSSTHVMSYMAKDLEILLDDLYKDTKKLWYLPVLESRIIVAPYVHGETKLTLGKFNILEPQIENDKYYDQKSKKIKLDLILVPGLCFDQSGHRIGFGRGYYDSFLKLNKDAFKIGCCPKECLVDTLPIDKWDIKVDMIVS